jgi:diguanylate cyclase (GGDEF)-like protein
MNRRFLAVFEKRSKLFWMFLGMVLIAGVGIIDFLTGYELAFSLFYLIPVSIVAWVTTLRLGIVTALVSAMVWLTADAAAGNFYSQPFIYAWNTLIRFSFFIVTVLLLSALKRTLGNEKELARTDYLTGAANSRFFYDLLEMEMARFPRYKRPFTLVYIDLDNFKAVNDRFGHLVGDQVLCLVVNSTKNNLRKTDVVARLGGDEFALLLPETDQESARVALAKIHGGLIKMMRQNDWPVTFSIGALTCSAVPASSDELLRIADELMYDVKCDSKDAIKYSVYAG